MKIKKAPNPFKNIKLIEKLKETKNLSDYFEFMKPVDEKGRYLHWDALRHYISKECDPLLAWSLVKQARGSGARTLPFKDTNTLNARLYVTDLMQKICSQVDRLTSSAAEKELLQRLDGRSYFIKELFGEESISSSQLEGAATTTRVAQEMLQVKREPRNEGERMIAGNYRMMQFVIQKANEELSPALIREIHATGVSAINDGKYKPGQLRQSNNIVVEDTASGEIIHQPPCYTAIDLYLKEVCHWANEPHEKNLTGSYIHPLLKACILHFMIAWIHPFSDGNGRTARALFYWYMIKCGYSAFKHISISRLLKEAPTSYVKSYVYTESDDFDLTYFVTYQCEIISRAVQAYIQHIKDLIQIRTELDEWLWHSKLSQELNARQRQIMSVAVSHPGKIFSTGEAMENLNVSYNTARTDFQKLARMGLLKPHKEGKETLYIAPKNLKQLKKWSNAEESLPQATGW